MAHQSRRARNSGSVPRRPRKDGRWEARLTLPSGKRKSFYGETWAEAEAKMIAARSDIERGLFTDPGRTTVNDLAEMYLELNPNNLARRTIDTRRGHYRRDIGPEIGRMRIRDVTGHHCQRVISKARDRGLASSTLAGVYSTMSAFFRYAADTDLIARSPVDRIRAPKSETAIEFPVLTTADIDALLDAFEKSQIGTLMILAVGLSLRSSEARGLRWSDIDFDRGVVHVRVQANRYNDGPAVVPLKTKSSRRTIPMPAFVVDALKRERRKQAERRLRLGPEWIDHDFVVTRNGKKVPDTTLAYHMHKVCKIAGVPALTFHQLRHLCASILMRHGVPVRAAQAILGHASGTMTLHYQHATPDDILEAVATLDTEFSRRRRSGGNM